MYILIIFITAVPVTKLYAGRGKAPFCLSSMLITAVPAVVLAVSLPAPSAPLKNNA
jgi:ABC-type Fe3+ transport system permease subunit